MMMVVVATETCRNLASLYKCKVPNQFVENNLIYKHGINNIVKYVSDNSCSENQKTHFMFNYYSKILPFMR